jgi:ribosomal protein S18 acetylase RimI-like enzyme
MEAKAAAATLRALTPADLSAAQALTETFGWPYRVEDCAFMLRLGSGVVAERDGALTGMAMGWAYGRTHGCIGFIGVSPAAQGQGLGRLVTQAVIDGLGDRTLLLSATEAGQPLYRSLGFREIGMVRQHQGTASRGGLIALPPGDRLRPVGRSDPKALAALDRAACGMDRGKLLAALAAEATGVVLDRGGTPAGFALMRRFGRGQVLGPVVAPDQTSAKALILHFLGTHSGQFVRIDVPDEAGLSAWLEELGLADVGPAVRMVRGAEPGGGGTVRSFALASQAFG